MNRVKILMLFTFITSMIAGLVYLDNKEVIVAGTEGRTEEEYKISFTNNIDISSEIKIIDLINKKIDLILKDEKFKEIERVVNSKFYLTNEQAPLVFVDYYFDDNFELYKSWRSYRLRYRFKSESEFYSYMKVQDKSSYPIRCEIQLKVYEENKGDYYKAQEYRFEFRDESAPFNSDSNPAPLPPWPIEKFLQIAKNGKYKNYHILPHFKLGEKLSLKNDVHLITKRKRFHLNIKTPWGSGPNPEQAFIISIDNSLVPKNGKSFSEIEIEFERNVSTKLEQLSSTDPNIMKISDKFKSIQELVYNELKQELIQNNFSLSNPITKYRRTIELTNERILQ